MGIATRDKSSDLSNDKNAFIVPPVFPGLLAWAYLGGSIEKSIRNLAFGQPGFTVVGNPEVHPNFLRFKGGLIFFAPPSSNAAIIRFSAWCVLAIHL